MQGIDEQTQFRRLQAAHFMRTQTIREKRDREKHNARYTQAFRAAFTALEARDYEEAALWCKRLKRKSFLWLLYAEFAWYCDVQGAPLPDGTQLSRAFGIQERKWQAFVQSVREKLPANKYAAKSYAQFRAFVEHEGAYRALPVRNLAVCATMSAGKSTFVNALLGRDVLPARNEATTAKITSVYDKDGAESMVGFVQQENAVAEPCCDVGQSIIDAWNSDASVQRIFLQGDLDGIGNNGSIVAVHDTPGTNNSGDKSHHDVTFEFLEQHNMDALIYVANATQLCTTDERALLTELLKRVVRPHNIPLLFVLNKADELDPQKEAPAAIAASYSQYLAELGFEKPAVFLLSAKAARLLKMARSGRAAQLTAREAREFSALVGEFTELHDFSSGAHTDTGAQSGAPAAQNADSAAAVTVGKSDYPLPLVRTALERTGLPQVELHIERLFGGEQ